MGTIVMKFGGPAVSSPEKIMEAAQRVRKAQKQGHSIVVVTSSMAGIRRELRHLVGEMSDDPEKREMDVLLAAGAQMASALLAIAIIESGGKAVSLTGWQASITTDDLHLGARIEKVNTERIMKHLHQGEIVVVAAAIKAERVEIYTDVDGIYTADPAVVSDARKVTELTYDEMLELSGLGAEVLHPRAVELAKKYNMPIVIRSGAEKAKGTTVKGETEMEKNLVVRGVAYEADVIRLTVGYDSYEETALAELFTVLAENGIDVDIIVQAVIDGVKPTISFSLEKEEFAEALRVLESSKLSLGFSFADFEVGLAKVSIVGADMVSNPGVAARMFARLSKEGIRVKMVSTSEIKVSVVVAQDEMVKAANALHDEFQLSF